MQLSEVQCSAVQCSVVQCCAVQCGQCSVVQCNADWIVTSGRPGSVGHKQVEQGPGEGCKLETDE